MKTVTQLLREHLLSSLGCIERRTVPDYEELREMRWLPEFERLMRNRLMMGAFRYECEDLCRVAKASFDNVSSMRDRLFAYEQTGDLEHLVDIANLCMLEFRSSRHPLRHFGDGGDHDMHVKELS